MANEPVSDQGILISVRGYIGPASARYLRDTGATLYLCNLKPGVHAALERGGFLEEIGRERVWPTKAEALRALYERFDTGIHTHLLETRKQADLAQQRFGTTIVQQLAKLGVLSDRWSCAHSIWLSWPAVTR